MIESDSKILAQDPNKMDGQIELLNEIMLELSIEIGQAKIKIAELLDLSKGDSVMLEQKPEDPLIIYANDKAIAKGQIISVNGRYNIRIL